MKRYDVNQLSLFGSTVRDQARAGSDIDILVSFNGAATQSVILVCDLSGRLAGAFC